MSFDWREIEEKWRKEWEKAKIFEADPDPKREKCFVTFPYPYMNGPLHLGHGFTATRVDVYARYKRMRGFNTLFPWAWHWTGEPILGAALRVKSGDPEMIRALKEIDGVPEEELKKFVDPIYMARYYTSEGREAVRKIGFSVDWRREFHTTSLEPTYSRFIEWQYETLRRKGYVVRGTHPVVWCPNCRSPTGDHDRLEGEGVSAEEYVLLKFQFNDAYLPAATFRPETIYGVTNMFLNPDADYVEAVVDGEKWIISREAASKLSEQLKSVKVLREFKGAELIGEYFVDPISKRRLPILPGWFVDPESATGVVYSVPAHAPADWIALKDLINKPDVLRKFGIDPEVVRGIKPISLIEVEGYGDYPAVEIIEKMGIKDQFDPRVDEATSTIYRKEFHTGVLKPITGKYAGKRVQDVKSELIEDFKQVGIADIMYDLPEKVVCRCTTRCIVKVLSDQWFLKYSDPEWKEMAHEAVDEARIYPEEARAYFHDKIDWLHDWACARRTGLGTPLPWSPGWIVETLSDSTIYMAFYTIIKLIRQHNIKAEQLTNEVFDYIFLGMGNPEDLAEESGIAAGLLKEMRREFTYWYPVDLRVSAKELVPNHLSFFIFQHTALFPREFWPRAIGVNGMLSIEGKKMSKSKGNFLTLSNVVDNFGADVTRLTLMLGAEGMDDPDWRVENAKSIDSRLRALYRLIGEIVSLQGDSEMQNIDRWLISVIQGRIKSVTEAIETLRTRTAAEVALFEVWNDIRWYLRRAKKRNPNTLREVAEMWIRLLAPFTPHLCEELWHLMGNEGFVSTAEWPKYDEGKVDVKAEESESLIRNLMADTASIIGVTKMTPKKICYYVASGWKWRSYLEMIRESLETKIEMRTIMRELMKDPELRREAKKISVFVSKALQEINAMPTDQKKRRLKAGELDEEALLKEAKRFLEKEFKAEILVYKEEDPLRYDPKNRANLAKPYRPAIYIE
ncbi:MAG: putative leucyl-tRNA synthetase [Candidatus Bathyarchaeota archaeon B63]|nr:MAG: putative leucyl-tRNA synthetase [Candidatus Bathyarchaeota archaeon B63]